METVQVRLNDELSRLLNASVKTGAYSTKSEVVREAIRSFFAPELKREVLLEAMKRGKSKDFVPHSQVMKEFGLE